jgi:hypothetical protein
MFNASRGAPEAELQQSNANSPVYALRLAVRKRRGEGREGFDDNDAAFLGFYSPGPSAGAEPLDVMKK